MKKINKTVLLASTLFITSAINLTDKAYANEDNKSLVKESVDRVSEDKQDSIEVPDSIKEIESSSYTNYDQFIEEDGANKSNLKEATTEAISTPKESSNNAISQSPEPKVEVDGDMTEKRIPGVIYYDNSNLDDTLKKIQSTSKEVKELHDEQIKLEGESYYAENGGGYFVKKNNKINYYRNNRLVRNANIKVDDRIYRADKTGTISNPKNMWLSIGKDIYYNNANGTILRGINQIGKSKFYFRDDGALERNRKLITQGAYYEVDNAGRMNLVANKWVNVNKNIYRTLGDGKIAKGITKIGANDFFFDKDGKLQTNKKLILSDKYYEVNPIGIVTNPKNKWVTLDGSNYWTKADGSIAKGATQINGNTYVFDYKTGAMIAGRPSITGGLYYSIDDKGIATLVKDEWVTFEGKTFH